MNGDTLSWPSRRAVHCAMADAGASATKAAAARPQAANTLRKLRISPAPTLPCPHNTRDAFRPQQSARLHLTGITLKCDTNCQLHVNALAAQLVARLVSRNFRGM